MDGLAVVKLTLYGECSSEEERRIVAPEVEISKFFTYPNGRVAEWFKAPSWKGGEGNTSASSNLVSSSRETCIGSRGNGERRAI